MSIKHALLGLLADGPLHGYELKTAYDENLVPASQLNYGQVYTTLERLGRDGLVAHEIVSQTERPDKKVYALTDEGRKELHAWLDSPSRLDLDLRNETFLKLILARRLSDANPLEVLAVERQSCFARLHEVSQTKTRAQREGASVQTLLLLDLAILRLEAFLKWLDRCEEVLKKECNE
ncbi:MAG TPA: PadR family transcriptional regulator [Gemmataceae bacterium]|nr:PadR family transcriptional regulator [Gemmataceae bacterium]